MHATKINSPNEFLLHFSFKLSPKQGTFALPKFSILNTTLADTCPKQSFCRGHKYRATDGSCNNINHQRWGTPGTALQRILPPKYGDGKYNIVSCLWEKIHDSRTSFLQESIRLDLTLITEHPYPALDWLALTSLKRKTRLPKIIL